jgi:hypothetical protein
MDKAISEYKEALALKPGYAVAQQELDRAIAQKNHPFPFKN